MSMQKGRINSFQTLGTLDGPGVRFIVFMQGCNLSCGCCHNPETRNASGGTEYTEEEILARVLRYKEYFGKDGGITLSGGEPLLQAEFAKHLFELCHENGINTCIDTSGSIINEATVALLDVTDHVLLDIKYTDDALYRKYAGCPLSLPLEFLEKASKKGVCVTLRQVIIPTLNDNEENIKALKKIAEKYNVVKTELLPFKKLCKSKYDELGIKFPFADIPEPSKALMDSLKAIL